MMTKSQMEQYMSYALEEARKARFEGEIPVGAVVVKGSRILSCAHNLTIQNQDATQHAELLAMQEAAKKNHGRLDDCTLFVTLEPCAMCAGAAMNLRVSEIVFGAFDEENGFCGSLADITDHWTSHSISTIGGILEMDCKDLLSSFFQAKR